MARSFDAGGLDGVPCRATCSYLIGPRYTALSQVSLAQSSAWLIQRGRASTSRNASYKAFSIKTRDIPTHQCTHEPLRCIHGHRGEPYPPFPTFLQLGRHLQTCCAIPIQHSADHFRGSSACLEGTKPSPTKDPLFLRVPRPPLDKIFSSTMY